MEVAVLVALIGVAGTLLGLAGALVGAWLTRRSERQRIALEARRDNYAELEALRQSDHDSLVETRTRLDKVEGDLIRVQEQHLAKVQELNLERLYTAMLLAWGERGAPPPPPTHPALSLQSVEG